MSNTDPGVQLPGWLVTASPWIVAAIGAAAVVLVRLIRGPVTIQDLWKENRQLRADIAELSTKVNTLAAAQATQFAVNRIQGEGFDALLAAVERSGVKLNFTPQERESIAKARALRADDELWNTLQRNIEPDRPAEESEQP